LLGIWVGGKVVIKAQVHAGGRGKAGGIKTATSPSQAEKEAANLLGSRLKTHQTEEDGLIVNAVLVEEALDCVKELYLGITVDSTAATPVVVSSEVGGMEIEQIADEGPLKG
jgi:succinyl-CoA synthetase beta subunit